MGVLWAAESWSSVSFQKAWGFILMPLAFLALHVVGHLSPGSLSLLKRLGASSLCTSLSFLSHVVSQVKFELHARIAIFVVQLVCQEKPELESRFVRRARICLTMCTDCAESV